MRFGAMRAAPSRLGRLVLRQVFDADRSIKPRPHFRLSAFKTDAPTVLETAQPRTALGWQSQTV